MKALADIVQEGDNPGGYGALLGNGVSKKIELT